MIFIWAMLYSVLCRRHKMRESEQLALYSDSNADSENYEAARPKRHRKEKRGKRRKRDRPSDKRHTPHHKRSNSGRGENNRDGGDMRSNGPQREEEMDEPINLFEETPLDRRSRKNKRTNEYFSIASVVIANLKEPSYVLTVSENNIGRSYRLSDTNESQKLLLSPLDKNAINKQKFSLDAMYNDGLILLFHNADINMRILPTEGKYTSDTIELRVPFTNMARLEIERGVPLSRKDIAKNIVPSDNTIFIKNRGRCLDIQENYYYRGSYSPVFRKCDPAVASQKWGIFSSSKAMGFLNNDRNFNKKEESRVRAMMEFLLYKKKIPVRALGGRSARQPISIK
ncbi:hypothetical protein ENBRE01_2760 [Enteropsectra breve]|nr:hypothetical protein ENBRE01_2760 [Enteropsectra breve]